MNSISGVQQWYIKLVLTPLLDFSLSSEVATMWQINSTAHKLKPRSFYKSTHLWVHLADFHPQCELYLTVLSNSQVCCCFWAVPSAKILYHSSICKFNFTFCTSSPKWLPLTVILQLQLQSYYLEHLLILYCVSATV